MATLSDEDKEQLTMYRELKELVRKGRITVINTSETNDKITISLTLTKKAKTIDAIRKELNTGYRWGG